VQRLPSPAVVSQHVCEPEHGLEPAHYQSNTNSLVIEQRSERDSFRRSIFRRTTKPPTFVALLRNTHKQQRSIVIDRKNRRDDNKIIEKVEDHRRV
jgi:hypothetical protein